jgi:hypothetical protein
MNTIVEKIKFKKLLFITIIILTFMSVLTIFLDCHVLS